MAECGKLVGKGVVNYPCIVARDHTGPCMSPDNAASVRTREAWDKAVLREMQAHPVVVVRPDGTTEQATGQIRELREGYHPDPPVVMRQVEGALPPVAMPQVMSHPPPTAPPWGAGLRALDREEKAADRGGQPVPIHQEGEPSMHDLLMAEVEKRKSLGLSRYGTILQANNGRDALQDLLDELIDGCVYLMQLIRERDLRRAEAAQPEDYGE